MMTASRQHKLLKIIILIVLLLLVLYAYGSSSKSELDDEARKAAPGSFITLTRGSVHYELLGPESAATVVLIHGLATPQFIWDHNVTALVDAGYRVLRYDHYGRGFSDRPDVVYNNQLYDQQLLELLQALDIKQPVTLVGLSMGGAVATVFTDLHPEMVQKMVLIAPAGFSMTTSFTIKLARLPVLGEFLMALVGDEVILDGVKAAFVDPDKLDEFEQKFKVPLQYAGFQRAILSTLRHMDMTNLSDAYYRVGQQQKPVMLVWGTEDEVIPFANSELVKQAIPHLLFHDIQAAGHNLNYENPEKLNPLLVEFLSQ